MKLFLLVALFALSASAVKTGTTRCRLEAYCTTLAVSTTAESSTVNSMKRVKVTDLSSTVKFVSIDIAAAQAGANGGEYTPATPLTSAITETAGTIVQVKAVRADGETSTCMFHNSGTTDVVIGNAYMANGGTAICTVLATRQNVYED